MRPRLSLLWSLNAKVGREAYLTAGAVLVLVKFLLDWAIATHLFGQNWSPMNYLIWPNDRTVHLLELKGEERTFALVMAAVSLPFIWTGVMLTLHRLRSAGLPLVQVVLFFVPVVNLLFFAMLCWLEEKPEGASEASTSRAPQEAKHATDAARAEESSTPIARPAPPELPAQPIWPGPPMNRIAGGTREDTVRPVSPWIAVLISVPMTIALVAIGARFFENYGFGLFVGSPFALGMFSVLIYGSNRPQPFGACVQVAMTAMACAGVGLLLCAMEGAICILMAAPIVVPLVFLGAVVGYAIQSRPWLQGQATAVNLLLVLAIPGLMAAEARNEPAEVVRAVRTSVEIDAPPEVVWRNVISFPALAEPTDWFFRTGIAYPQRAEIEGTGVGAVRHCIFSTGAFVEPIDVWEPAKRLHFQVTDQPEPMKEWSPYNIHPAHLDHYLVSREGEFLLEPLAGGRTRLVGTTWYTNRMWPAVYWNLWSDAIIHRIHERVLKHIEGLAETGEAERVGEE